MNVPSNKQPIILIGGGGHCISVIDVIERTGLYEIKGILDLPEKVGNKILNIPIIGTDEDIKNVIKECNNFHITVGQIKSPAIRENIFSRVKELNGNLPVLISPYAYVSPYAKIDEGTVIMHQALVNAKASVGKACIINSKALIEHEAAVGDFCHISTGSIVNGQSKVGSRTFIGSNTVVSNNIDIVENTVVGAGSQVIKSITVPGVYSSDLLKKIR
ncbi:acetyltransferase [Prolixibacter denitrificans]|uniref:Acetyltransferase n=1 Tax=Prolixibacter denitrificans TaxID=1541063 RepID=A0A2P8C8N5_9BACT|nr:acetyltransferase [Prolixibacter denitrificans]PSK81333.1 sugar O-acyltransferase (sialic acid O-acetyltransferase NeuD family) [Prolixibacter denitrificans]GET21582.1 acetyltransferase [Prolixibacter denitrificans]